jgi:hypothetical protein
MVVDPDQTRPPRFAVVTDRGLFAQQTEPAVLKNWINSLKLIVRILVISRHESPSLLREVHAADEVLKTRFGAKGVEFGVGLQKVEKLGPFGEGLVERVEGLSIFA